MTQRDDEFLALYREKRFDDQRKWYADRVDEYERAHDQIITATGAALFLASVAGLAASADLGGLRVAWAVLAAAVSGLATLVRAYDNLLGYEQNSKVYRDASAALGRLRARAPWMQQQPMPPDRVGKFVTEAEDVFQREISQWGQLTAIYEPPEAGTQLPKAGPQPPLH